MTNLTNLRNASPTRLGSLPEDRIPLPPLSPPASSGGGLLKKIIETQVPRQVKSGIVVNERSDSGISELSECSSSNGEFNRRRSSSSVQPMSPTNVSVTPSSGMSLGKNGKIGGLSWQNSVDSAVSEDEDKNFTTATPTMSKESLLKADSSCVRSTNHTRI